jgi:hypothetical protein
MKIQVKRWNESTRETLVDEVEVVLVQTYRGHDIMRCKNNWLYVFDESNWQYLGSVREAQWFIRNTDWK